MMRTNGMELVGTELQPDWFVEGGNYGEGVTWQDRATNSTDEHINIASADEISRAAAHGVEPEELWHYRSLSKRMIYQAADIAWAAAKSMTDNSDDTARFLCIAGTWLKKLTRRRRTGFTRRWSGAAAKPPSETWPIKSAGFPCWMKMEISSRGRPRKKFFRENTLFVMVTHW
jgi:hypothetical protein